MESLMGVGDKALKDDKNRVGALGDVGMVTSKKWEAGSVYTVYYWNRKALRIGKTHFTSQGRNTCLFD